MPTTKKTKTPTKTKTTAAKKSQKITSQPAKKTATKKYYEAVGRRKTSVARVRLYACSPFEGENAKIEVNGQPYAAYFKTEILQQIAEGALKKLKSVNRFEVSAKVSGGGINGQAEALRHGIARTLVLFNADFRKKLKRSGYLRRDPRMKERKKPGLKKARRAPQWSKR